MAIQTKHQVLNDANSLLLRFQEAQNTIQNLKPLEQLEKGAALSRDASLLTQLQNRVQASFLRGQDAIPEVTEEELLTIATKLSEASDILDKIQANSNIAADLVELAADVHSIFEGANRGNVNPQQVQALNGRLVDLTNKPQINPGNQDGVGFLQAKILSYQQPGGGSVQAPAVRDADVITEQNESFQVTEFHDRWGVLFPTLKMVAKEDFYAILPFYGELKKYESNKTQFVAQKNKVVFEDLLQSVGTLLDHLVKTQKSDENIQASGSEGLRVGDNRAVNTSVLQELKGAFDFACGEMGKPNPDFATIDKLVQEAFSKISPAEKEQVLNAVNMIHQAAGKRVIPQTLLGQPCKMWTDYHTLQKALHVILSSAPPAKAVAAPAAKAVGSPALNELKNVLENAQTNAVGFTPALQKASGALSENEKKELHKALSDVLIEQNKIAFTPSPPALLKMGLNVWPGTPAQKLKAVEKMLAPKAAAPVAAPAVVKKASDEMAARLAEVRARFAPAVKSVRSEAPKEAQKASWKRDSAEHYKLARSSEAP